MDGICNTWAVWNSRQGLADRINHMIKVHLTATGTKWPELYAAVRQNDIMMLEWVEHEEDMLKMQSDNMRLVSITASAMAKEKKQFSAKAEKLSLPVFTLECSEDSYRNNMEKYEEYVKETEISPEPETRAKILMRCWDNDVRNAMKDIGT